MTIRRIAACRAIFAATCIAAVAGAQAPAGAGSGRPPGPPGKGHEQGMRAGEHGRGPDHDHAHGPGKGGPGPAGSADEGGGGGHGHHPPGGGHGMRGFMDELKSGKLKKEDVKARLEQLRESRGTRQQERREALKERWGATLAAPSAREELDLHARRLARLDRAMVVAETDPAKAKNEKLKAKIAKLTEQENARHERAMERIKAQPVSPSASAAAPAAAAPSAEQPAGEK